MTVDLSEHAIEIGSLPSGENAVAFDGHEHGASVSFFITRSKPGTGLHKHPYDETFIMEEGGARMVVVPADTPHGFVKGESSATKERR